MYSAKTVELFKCSKKLRCTWMIIIFLTFWRKVHLFVRGAPVSVISTEGRAHLARPQTPHSFCRTAA